MINQIISDGSGEPSVLYDLGATYNYRRGRYNFILSNIPSKRVFHMPNGSKVRAIIKSKMHHKQREL